MENNKIKGYLFPECIIWNENMYFFTALERSFCKMNMSTFEVSYIESFDVQNTDITTHVPGKMLLADNRIYSLDNGGKYLLIYDLLNDSYTNIEIGFDYRPWGNFISFYRYRDSVLAFHRECNVVLEVEIRSGAISKQYTLCEADMTYTCSCQVEERIYLFPEHVQYITMYNAKSHKGFRIALPEEIEGCRKVMWKNNIFYILCQNGEIVLWDEVENRIERLGVNGLSEEALCFGSHFITEKYIWIMPARGNDIFRYDIKSRKAERYNSYPNDFGYYAPREWTKYAGYFETQDKYYLAMWSVNYILVIDKENGKEEWIKPKLPTEKTKMKRLLHTKKGMISEREISLNTFLQYVYS